MSTIAHSIWWIAAIVAACLTFVVSKAMFQYCTTTTINKVIFVFAIVVMVELNVTILVGYTPTRYELKLIWAAPSWILVALSTFQVWFPKTPTREGLVGMLQNQHHIIAQTKLECEHQLAEKDEQMRLAFAVARKLKTKNKNLSKRCALAEMNNHNLTMTLASGVEQRHGNLFDTFTVQGGLSGGPGSLLLVGTGDNEVGTGSETESSTSNTDTSS